eukprot:TRINITY_DN1334_c0_g1_i1.p1 TRINITY_DN1334_c0_g1~~TRINITY_DN1334_c0_g1_i1.p1  ORF type:complete len:133 (+),score=40.80 TRINITY_DN1334_c0_g1_i1:35-400(+)
MVFVDRLRNPPKGLKKPKDEKKVNQKRIQLPQKKSKRVTFSKENQLQLLDEITTNQQKKDEDHFKKVEEREKFFEKLVEDQEKFQKIKKNKKSLREQAIENLDKKAPKNTNKRRKREPIME